MNLVFPLIKNKKMHVEYFYLEYHIQARIYVMMIKYHKISQKHRKDTEKIDSKL